MGFAAPFALVTGFGALLAVGTVAAALHGRFSATGVLVVSAAVVTAWSFAAEPLAAIPLGVVGWLTAVGFSRPPYAQLRMTGPFAGRRRDRHGRLRAGRGVGLGQLTALVGDRPAADGVGAGATAGQPATARSGR